MRDDLLTEIPATLRRKRAETIIALVGMILALLVAVIWWGWLHEIVARTGAVIPKRVLGAAITALLILLATSLLFVLHFYRELVKAQAKNKALAESPVEVEPENIELRQSLAHLNAFSENLPTTGHIEEKFVDEYDEILTRLERETGHNLATFRIMPEEIQHRVIQIPARIRGGFVSGEPRRTTPASTKLSEKRYCNRNLFTMRLHAAINFFAK